jgi:ubiquinone/menaquinone biosynthesis C-methylase UbiE
MDVRNICYPDNYFDLAVDKSTIDALLCGEQSFINVAKMTREIQRILKEGGIYMMISYGAPENRIFHLERDHLSFDINIYTIKKDYSVDDDNQKYEKMHYVYVCKKKAGADEISRNKFENVISELEEEEKIEQEYYNLKNNENNMVKDNEEPDDDDDYFDEEYDNFSSENKEVLDN